MYKPTSPGTSLSLTFLLIRLLNFHRPKISFFIIVSSSNEYAHRLGGDSTFSGVVLGIPTVFSGLALIPMMRYDGGMYFKRAYLLFEATVVSNRWL